MDPTGNGMGTMTDDGYSVNMRQDVKSCEYLAFIPAAYLGRSGPYYMAYTLMDGWVEVSPEYATKGTRTVTEFPANLKRATDSNLGYILNLAPRLYGQRAGA